MSDLTAFWPADHAEDHLTPDRQNAPAVRPGHLVTTCWCERRTVYVPRADIRQGITRSCGAEGCAP